VTERCDREVEVKRIPALIVSGFLGSGKTTLVQHLLRRAQAAGMRAAVVSNEFGELGIDRALLSEGGEALVELQGGCVCCQLSNELLNTLQMLWERFQPDQVIVETAGVALPGDVQLNFWREPVSEWISDEVVVVVVNAEQVLQGRDLDGTFMHQVNSADLLLLNKIDLIPAGAIGKVEAHVRQLEPDAAILCTVHSAIDPAVLFPPGPCELRGKRSASPSLVVPHSHADFVAEEIVVEDGVEEAVLAERFRALEALRVKGFIRGASGLRIVQGVGARVEFGPVPVAPLAELIGRVVVIRRRG
jgi:cobalamin biosynthesis protein CobW